jgi:hypothetical protein
MLAKIDDDEIAKDGEVLRVPAFLMDGRAPVIVSDGFGGTRMNQPGFRFGDAGSECSRAEAREEYVGRLERAWRDPTSETRGPSAITADQARDEYVAWLTNAWRGTR